MDLGIMVEGVVDKDLTGRLVLRTPQGLVDILEQAEKHQGKEVRFILTPLEAIAELAHMVEAGDIKV